MVLPDAHKERLGTQAPELIEFMMLNSNQDGRIEIGEIAIDSLDNKPRLGVKKIVGDGRASRQNSEFRSFAHSSFKDAWDWFRDEMRTVTGRSPLDVDYPSGEAWLWAQIDMLHDFVQPKEYKRMVRLALPLSKIRDKWQVHETLFGLPTEPLG